MWAGNWRDRTLGVATARELSGSGDLWIEEPEGVGRVIGEMATRGGDGGAIVAVDQRQAQVAYRGQDLGCRTGAQAGAVLPEGDVAHPVSALDPPVPADQGEQVPRVGLGGRAAWSAGRPPPAACPACRAPAGPVGRPGCRPARWGQVVVEQGSGAQAALLGAPPASVDALRLPAAGGAVGEGGGQVVMEGGLVALDGEQVVPPAGQHRLGEGHLRVQGIGTGGLKGAVVDR